MGKDVRDKARLPASDVDTTGVGSSVFRYPIRFRETLVLRLPVLESVRFSFPFQVEDEKWLVLERPIEEARPHEQFLLRFLLDPHDLAEGGLAVLDTPARISFVKALYVMFASEIDI